MRTLIKTGHLLVRLSAVCVASVALLLSIASVAQAASPAWKLLAATGPSNLPPKQSEVQRVIVEAEGGTFRLGRKESESTRQTRGVPIVLEAQLSLVSGSTTATIESIEGVGRVEPGDRIARPFEFESTTIVSCSTNCEAPGSTLELSEPASGTETGAVRQIFTREVELNVGAEELEVGEDVTATNAAGEEPPFGPFLPPGTTVTAVDPGTFTLSNPTTAEYITAEGELRFTGKRVMPAELTSPIPKGAAATLVQSELEALPDLGPGSVSVVGEGTVEHPYLINFAGEGGHGSLALQDVPQLEVERSALMGEGASANVFTVVPGGPGTGEIVVYPTNIGGAPSQGPITLSIGPLPAGVQATAVGAAPEGGWACSEASGSATDVCTLSEVVPPLQAANSVRLPIKVESTVASSSFVPVQISGGGSEPGFFQLPVEISFTPADFGTRAFWAGAFNNEGQLETQAGAHPESAQTFFILNTARSASGQIIPAGILKNVEVDLPAGFIGNPTVTPRCPQSQLAVAGEEGLESCNSSMAVGEFVPVVSTLPGISKEFLFPIFNDVPAKGSAAEFTTKVQYPYQSLFGSLRSEEDFGVRIVAPNVPNAAKLFGSYAALQGRPAGGAGKAFLTNPTDCSEEAQRPPVTNLRFEAYELAGVVSTSSVPIPPVTGCDKLQFTPNFALSPYTTQGSSPSGAVADLHVPQAGLIDADSLAQPDLKKAVVTLPEGLVVNPSSANGLAACSEAQIGYVGPGAKPNPTRFNENPVSCPDASKLGTVEIKTPLLDEGLEGTIYLAAQEENPFGSLIAVYLVVESERFGIKLKLPGKVELNERTGQLTAVFDNNPQVPFEDLTLNFRGGGTRATFGTPEMCGHYQTTGSLEPWSAPESGTPTQIVEGGFNVLSNCASSASTRPFSPTLEAGTVGTRAGSYSPLVIRVARKDGEQELKSLDFTLPKGLTGKLAGIPYCSDSAIKTAEGKSGKAEQASPSCPTASQIGVVDTAAGFGTEPFHVSGKIYLAGPYKGAPLSSVVVTPAVAGPFDLGDVVIRAPLFVDPESTQITAKSDPIPTILKGIPLKVRSVVIDLNRPSFTLTPTSCEEKRVTASIEGSSGATATPLNRFQVGGCDRLGFKPKLKISLRGSTAHTGHPAVKAVLTYPKKGTYSNIRRAQVNLPHSEFLEQSNLNKTCTKPFLLDGKCPANTIYGRARAWTPLLAKPVEGPVYLVGGYGYKLPALVADLNGQIRVVLKGKVDTGPNGGIRNTFEAVPDAPVSRFVLELKGGRKYGLLVNSEDLCAKPRRAIARFTAQNGKVDVAKPLINDHCGRPSGK